MSKNIIFTTAFVPLPGHFEMTFFKCLDSFTNQYDEVIVVQNGVSDEIDLTQLTKSFLKRFKIRHYIINVVNMYHAKAINQCADLCVDDDIIIFANNDTQATETTDLNNICRFGGIISPKIEGVSQPYGAHASFFAIDKKTFTRVGKWDVTKGHEADEDWFQRAQALKIPMYCDWENVVEHNAASTVRGIKNTQHDPDTNEELKIYLSKTLL